MNAFGFLVFNVKRWEIKDLFYYKGNGIITLNPHTSNSSMKTECESGERKLQTFIDYFAIVHRNFCLA